MIGHWGRVLGFGVRISGGAGLPHRDRHLRRSSPGTQAATLRRAASAFNGRTADPARTRAAIKEVLARPEFADLHADPNTRVAPTDKMVPVAAEAVSSAIGHVARLAIVDDRGVDALGAAGDSGPPDLHALEAFGRVCPGHQAAGFSVRRYRGNCWASGIWISTRFMPRPAAC